MKTFLIAEAGVNHNGKEDLALKLVDIAANSGADAVKFQTFRAENLVTIKAPKADYQKKETGAGGQYEMLKNLEMSEELHFKIFKRCQEVGIEFMSTPFDENALDFLIKLGMRRIKIPSGEITNLPFLRYVASKNLPIILSTGMSNLEEVIDAVTCVQDQRSALGYDSDLSKYLTILHCTSNYPAAYSDVNLRAMSTMANTLNLPVGYSDHTLGLDASLVAVSIGAKVIEKHFTIDKSLPGPDHRASLMPDELVELVRRIRVTEDILGSSVKEPTLSEIPVMKIARRSISFAIDVPKGYLIKEDDVVLLRPGNGIEPKYLDAVIGRELARPMSCGDTLQWSDLVPINK